MNKKYQIFISSTYEDLKAERAKVINALLYKNCIPVGMEYFAAADEDQMTVIKDLIPECDYFILILGGKYGTIEPNSQKSYTQLEYEYAVRKGIPVLAFYYKNTDNLTKEKIEIDETKRTKLEEFTNLVKGRRLCSSWNDASELAMKVSASLDILIKKHPETGWVKANGISSDEANREILSLREENAKLQQQINFLCSAKPDGTEYYEQGKDIFTIHYTILFDEIYSNGKELKKYKKEVSWDDIFLSIATTLLKPIDESFLKQQLCEKILSNDVSIDDNDFDTILVQLMALKLINVDIVKCNSVYTYWILTPYGRAEMVRLKAIRK